MQLPDYLNIHDIFPRAPKLFFRGLFGRTAVIKIAQLVQSGDGNWLIITTAYDYNARKIKFAYRDYLRLDYDKVFGIITGVVIGQPPYIAGVVERHWTDILDDMPSFSLWHFDRFLPVLQSRDGADKAVIQCRYFYPRGSDNPCHLLERENTYSQSASARRNAETAARLAAYKRGETYIPARKPTQTLKAGAALDAIAANRKPRPRTI